MARWFLVRHGETVWNAEGRVQGHLDSALTEAGLRNARRMAERLAPAPFAAAYCSDLGRARSTLAPILDGRSLPVSFLSELREKCYGAWEGFTFQEIREGHPDQHDRLFRDDVEFAPPGGESDEDLARRLRGLVERLRLAHSGDENILVLGHGGSLRAMMVNLLDLPVRSLWHFRLDNSGLSIIGVSPSDLAVHLWNDTSHTWAT